MNPFRAHNLLLINTFLLLFCISLHAQAGEKTELDDAYSQAGATVGGFIGYDLDTYDGEFFMGVDTRINFDLPDIASGFALTINPALGYYFTTGVTYSFQLDANLLAKYTVVPHLSVYGGLGPVMRLDRASGEFGGNTETERLFNPLVAGLRFSIDEGFDGFGQVRMTRFTNVFGSTMHTSVMMGLKLEL